MVNVTYTMYVKLRLFFHYLLVKIALFIGLLFASIAAIPHLDIGLDQELALPKVMDKNDFSFFFFSFCLGQGAGLDLRRKFYVRWI